LSYLTNPYMVTPAVSSYSLTWEQTTQDNDEAMAGNSNIAGTGEFFFTNHVVTGTVINKVEFYLKRINTPTETFTVQIQKGGNPADVINFIPTFVSDDLTTSYAYYPFTNDSNTYAIVSGDIICVFCTPSSSVNNIIKVGNQTAHEDYTQGTYFWVPTTSWIPIVTRDRPCTMKVYVLD